TALPPGNSASRSDNLLESTTRCRASSSARTAASRVFAATGDDIGGVPAKGSRREPLRIRPEFSAAARNGSVRVASHSQDYRTHFSQSRMLRLARRAAVEKQHFDEELVSKFPATVLDFGSQQPDLRCQQNRRLNYSTSAIHFHPPSNLRLRARILTRRGSLG